MSPDESPAVPPRAGADEPVRETDYAEDIAETTTHRASTATAASTDAQMKKWVPRVAIALIAAFALVRGIRFVVDYRLDRATEAALSAPRVVDVVAARPVDGALTLTLPGQTAAWYTSTIYGRVNGFVGRWSADIGDHVRKGQVLALIDTPELDAQLLAARAELRAAEAQVLARASDADFARTTNDRWRDSPQGVVSDQEREAKKADYDSSQARLKAAEAEVALDRARVDQYAALSEFKGVVAPFDGVITERHIDIGNLVTAGSTNATTPLYQMTQNDPIRVFVEVPQSVAAELLRPAQPVTIETDATERITLPAVVARAAGAINPQARTMRLEVDVENSAHRLLPGMYVKAAFRLVPKGLVQVPAATLLFRGGSPQVARIDAAGTVHFVNVAIARDDGSVLELASGVAAGDQLALNISSQIRDGDTVRIGSGAAGASAAPAGH
jgi:membrane fusion protein, multidrug efflux system